MPDLDDIFEDIFDVAKKFGKKRKQKHKKSKKRDKDKHSSEKPSLLQDLISTILDPSTSSEQTAPPQPADPIEKPQRSGIPAESSIKSSVLRGYLRQATSYEQGILDLMRNAPTEFNRNRMEELSRYIEHWRQSLEALVARVDQFQQDELLQQDLQDVPEAIKRLEGQLREGVPEKVTRELERTLNNRRSQLKSLQALEETMQWAEIKIENTVSMLGTLYSQSIMSQSKGQVGNYQRLLAEIEEESLSLNDYVTTLAEIKFGQNP